MLNNPVPVLVHYLKQLDALLVKIAASEGGKVEILDARLADDMLPFANQVRTAANFALRIACPLAGVAVPSYDHVNHSFAGLRQQIENTLNFLQTLTPADFAGDENRVIEDRAGFSDLRLPVTEYLYHYALQNFYFHLSMVFAIARSRQIPLGKADFDGYHQYPSGFSFER